jgi:muconate cycloisomerase
VRDGDVLPDPPSEEAVEREPDEVVLRLDANQGYRHLAPKAAAAVVRALHAAGAGFVEQPTEGLDAMAEVRRRTDAVIVADESCWQPADALEVDRRAAADALSIYLAKAGGIGPARRVAELAEVLGLPCDVNGSLESGVGNAANLHFAVAAPAVTLPCVIPVTAPTGSPDGAVGRYYGDDVVAAPFPYRDGREGPPEGPGLGIEVDEEKVRALAP